MTTLTKNTILKYINDQPPPPAVALAAKLPLRPLTGQGWTPPQPQLTGGYYQSGLDAFGRPALFYVQGVVTEQILSWSRKVPL